MASFGVFDEEKEKPQNWVGTDLGVPQQPEKPSAPVQQVDLGWGNWSKGAAPSTNAGIGDKTEAPYRLPNATLESIETGKARDRISKKEAELRGQGAFSPGTPEGSMPLLGSGNQGWSLVAEEPNNQGGGMGMGGGGGMDKQLGDITSRIQELSRGITPAKSGYMIDTYNENLGAMTEIKNLKDIMHSIAPLTSQGQGLEKQAMAGKQALGVEEAKIKGAEGKNLAEAEKDKAVAGYYNMLKTSGKPEPIEIQNAKAWDKDLSDAINNSGIMAQLINMKPDEANKAIAQFQQNYVRLRGDKPKVNTSFQKSAAAERERRLREGQ
jgi:hypothetical protein